MVAKVLAYRQNTVLPVLISKIQRTFVLGRVTTDNIMIAFKMVHSLKRRTQGKKDFGGTEARLMQSL